MTDYVPKDNGMPLAEVTQVGLWETDPNKVKEFAQRVARFNQRFMSNVKLDVEPHEKGDSLVDRPHYKLRIVFPNHEVQEAFWLE